MLNIYIFLLSSLFLLPQTLLSENNMKCAPGKCGMGKETMTKNIKIPQSKPTIKKLQRDQKKPTIQQLFNVTTVQVKNISMEKKQVNYGYIAAQEKHKIDVTTRYSGYVEHLFADTRYQKVNKGDILAKVYSAEVYRAKQDYLNSIKYNETRSAPEMLQSAKANLLLLGISPKEIRDIEKQRKVDAFTAVYAPISGWIFEKNINQGSSFDSRNKLFGIINLDDVWVEVKLFQDQIKDLHTLQYFSVKIKGQNTSYEATKDILYPMIDPKEATATLRLNLHNPQEIFKPGMYVKIDASTRNQNRLVIPRTATIRKNGTWYAFLATEFKGEYEPVEIDVTPLDRNHYEVIKGLHIEDTLVNNALFMMDSDAQINSLY
ncbi:MAG: efflux RND transporter periplasmic adaptor subunit [Campylobacterota bacterium]|nr:efflux RND transporter periplasmic adaptor subunit [Campylobacterota bacterium]